ncbi:MAG: TonB-dependent receptor [Pseudomonadota bacterium]|nr:TonB-dependent receptor [Pseudomonadota bacterium]
MAQPAFLALSCVGAFVSLPAWADGNEPAPANDGEDQNRNDVIVNGQRERKPVDPKQVAPLVDTPRSIIVLPKEVIAQTGSATLQDALRTVPGITFGAAEGGNPIGDRPFIRGFDSQGSIYVDGVRDLAAQTREVFAIDSVQIVRGSDSTLGGRGSAGGTIDIASKMPQLQSAATLTASYGNGDYKRVSGDMNVRVSDTVAARIEGVWHDQGFVDRDAVHARRWGVAPSVTIGLGTPTRLTASYYHLESHELPDSGIPYLYVCSMTLCNAPAGNVFTTPAQGNITLANGTRGYVARSTFYGLKDRDFRDATTNQATLRVEHDFGRVTLRNTARFNRDQQSYIYLLPDDSNGDVFGIPSIAPGTISKQTGGAELTGDGYVWRRANTRYGFTTSLIDQTDLSGTFDTGGIAHSFAVGSEFSWEKARRGAYVLATGSTISPRCDTVTLARYYCTSLFNPNASDPWANYASDTSTVPTPIVKGAPNTETQNDASTVAVYGFDSITLAPQLILNLGARYDRFRSTVTLPFAAGSTAQQYSRTDELFNYQVGAVFKPTHQTSVYASYATAATPPNSLLGEGREDNALPTTAATAGLLDQLKAQKTRSYEVGAKASLFHDQLQLGLAAFQTDIRNARVTIDANTVGFLGRTRIRGIELTANGTILTGWTVFGGYTYLDPRIIDGGNSALTAPANGAAPAQTVYVPSVNTGKQVPQTARNSVTATTNYAFEHGPLHGLQIGGSAIYMGRQYGGYADNRTATQTVAGVVTINPATTILSRGVPDYWRFDARASYQLSRSVVVSVNAQNLTDRIYYTQAYSNHYATIAPGRTVFGSLTLTF